MSSQKRLFRNPAGGRIAGVCAGIAEYLDTDVTLVRLAWVVLSIVPGGFVGGLVAYIAAWAIMPDASVPVGAYGSVVSAKSKNVDVQKIINDLVADATTRIAGAPPMRRPSGSSR